jgi:hypothetical protein
MHRPHQLPKRLMFAITLAFVLAASLPAQVTVLMSGGFSAAYREPPWRISSPMRELPRSPADEWRWSFCR